jgi:flagellar hook-length control protein FliK
MQFFPGVQSSPAPFMTAHGVFEAAANKAGQEFSDALCAHLEQPCSDRAASPVEPPRPRESEKGPHGPAEDSAGAGQEVAGASPHGDETRGAPIKPRDAQPHDRPDGGDEGRPAKAAADASVTAEAEDAKKVVAAAAGPEQEAASAGRLAGEGEDVSGADVEVELGRALEAASAVAKIQSSREVRARVEAKVEALHELLLQFRQSPPRERAELAVTLGERIKALKDDLATVARQESGSGFAQGETSVSRRASRAVGQLELLSQRLEEAGKAAQAIAAASAREPKRSAANADAGATAAVKEVRRSADARKASSRDVPETSGGAERIHTGGTEGKDGRELAPAAMRTATSEQPAAKQGASRVETETGKIETKQGQASEPGPEPEAAVSDPKPSRPKGAPVSEARVADVGKAVKASSDATAATVVRAVAARDAEQAAARTSEPERQAVELGARTAAPLAGVKGDQARHDARDGFFGASTREKSASSKSQASGAGKIVPEGESASQTAAQPAPSALASRAETAAGVRNAEVYQQIENGAFKNLGQGLRQLVIRLDPADLGQVSVILQVRGKEVQAVLRAGNQETSQILNEQLGQLRTQLEAQGLKVGKLEVQTQLADSQSQSQWQGAEQHNRYQENRELALSAQRWRNLERVDAELVRDVQNTPQREKLSQSGLDIFA